MFSRVIYVRAPVSASFFFMGESYAVAQVDHLFICSPVDESVGCHHFFAILNNAVRNISVQFFCGHIFISLAYIPRSGISGTYGSYF